jgi:hypothetical protein
MAQEELKNPTFWQGSETGSARSEGSSEEDSSMDDEENDERMEDDGDDPFDEGEAPLENPLQTPAAEDDPAAPSSEPLEHKRLFFEVQSSALLSKAGGGGNPANLRA